MFRIKKKEGILAEAYCLGSEDGKLGSLMGSGEVVKREDGKYLVKTLEAPDGEVCDAGSYIKIDSDGSIHPNTAEFFTSNHRHVQGNQYEQITRPLWAWMYGEPESEEIRFLTQHKGLVLNDRNKKEYYSAPLWGSMEKADMDAILVMYRITRDAGDAITDIEFNFVSRDVFYKTYRIITKPEGEVDADILIVTLSLIRTRTFRRELYENDGEPIEGSFTNEAPTKYLIRKLFSQRFTFFSKIIIMASKECQEDRLNKEGTRLQDMTTLEYYRKMVLDYMKELNPAAFQSQYNTDEKKEDLFEIVDVGSSNTVIDPKQAVGTSLMRIFQNKVINPWSANVYMDCTGGLRKEPMTGMMVMRCLEAAGYRVRSVIYSHHPNNADDVNRIIDMTHIYRMYDSVIAKSLLEDQAYDGIREVQQQIIKEQGLDYFGPEAYGGTDEDIRDYAKVYEGDEPYIFLSYAHKDMLLAQSFLKNLHKRGIQRIWYDQGIHPRDEWEKVIDDRLEHCSYFIALVTPTYIGREWCMRELKAICGMANEKKMLFIYCGTDAMDFEKTEEKEKLTEEEIAIVMARQHVMRNMFNEKEFYDKVLEDQELKEYIVNAGLNNADIFVNLSNHPSDLWSEEQRIAAEEYGTIVDIPFPIIEPDITKYEMNRLVQEYVGKILVYGTPAVMVQGEYVFTHWIVSALIEKGCLVLAARSNREVKERRDADGNMQRTSIFRFAGFAEY